MPDFFEFRVRKLIKTGHVTRKKTGVLGTHFSRNEWTRCDIAITRRSETLVGLRLARTSSTYRVVAVL